MRAPGVGHRVPREARSVAKERQRGAKGCQRRTKRGPGWAKGCQDGRSRAPKWCQNGSKMNLAMVKVPILEMPKNHWFFHSKWPRSQSRTSQNAPRGPHGRPLGRAEAANGRSGGRSGRGQGLGRSLGPGHEADQVLARAWGRAIAQGQGHKWQVRWQVRSC